MKSRLNRSKKLIAAFAVAGLLAGCAGGADTEPSNTETSSNSGGELKPVTVMMQWGIDGPEGLVLADLIAEYEAQTGNTVELTVVSGDGLDIKRTYEAAVLAGEEPDIVLTNLFASTVDWVSDGATVAVDSYVDEWGLSSVIREGALGVWDSPDGIRGFPYAGLQWPIFFNMKALGEVGIDTIPTTTDALIDASKKLRAAGYQPLAVGGNDWSGTKLFLQMVETYLDAEESKQLMSEGGFCANPKAMGGINLIRDLVSNGVFADNTEGLGYGDMVALYHEEQAAMMYSGQWSFAGVPESLAKETEFGGFPLASGAAWSKPTAYNSENGVGINISQNGAANIDAVEPFVKLMFDKKWLSRFAVEASIIPVVEPDSVDPSGANDLFVQAVVDLPTRVDYIPMPDDHVPGDVISALPAAVSLAFTPGSSADKICSAVDDVYSSAG